jgi:putative phage-type endonuclease
MSDIQNLIQNSPEWFAARLGKVTASRVADVAATTKSGFGASRANYMAQLIAERLTGTVAESYTNAAMQWGTATEPEARSAYEFRKDTTIELVGFVPHPKIAMSGASPDGLIGTDGLVEIKCPNVATHIDTLLGDEIDKKYLTQMQWQMACCPFSQWCDFVSYDPRMPEAMRLFVKRVQRDDLRIRELETTVTVFLDELEKKVAELTKRYPFPKEQAA